MVCNTNYGTNSMFYERAKAIKTITTREKKNRKANKNEKELNVAQGDDPPGPPLLPLPAPLPSPTSSRRRGKLAVAGALTASPTPTVRSSRIRAHPCNPWTIPPLHSPSLTPHSSGQIH